LTIHDSQFKAIASQARELNMESQKRPLIAILGPILGVFLFGYVFWAGANYLAAGQLALKEAAIQAEEAAAAEAQAAEAAPAEPLAAPPRRRPPPKPALRQRKPWKPAAVTDTVVATSEDVTPTVEAGAVVTETTATTGDVAASDVTTPPSKPAPPSPRPSPPSVEAVTETIPAVEASPAITATEDDDGERAITCIIRAWERTLPGTHRFPFTPSVVFAARSQSTGCSMLCPATLAHNEFRLAAE
jgi:hypothetical protein